MKTLRIGLVYPYVFLRNNFYMVAGLFIDLPDSTFRGEFMGVQMPSGRKPFIELFMMY
jgi:hypothetical protein